MNWRANFTIIELSFIGGQIYQPFVKLLKVLIAEMDATRSVDNDSGVGHKKRASQCDFIHVYMKNFRFPRFYIKKCTKNKH